MAKNLKNSNPFKTFSLYYCCSEGTLLHLQKFLQYITVEFILSIILLYPPPHSWNSFNMSHFSICINEYIIFLLHSASFTLSLYLPPSHRYHVPDRTCFTFCSLFLIKRYFCLLKVAQQGVFLWLFLLLTRNDNHYIQSFMCPSKK
jgi:hypothetical protein